MNIAEYMYVNSKVKYDQNFTPVSTMEKLN